MLRLTLSNQITLIQLADQKSNMIISTSTMTISALIGISTYSIIHNYTFTEIQFYKLFYFPIILVIVCCLFSIYYAVKSTKPKGSNRVPLSNKNVKSSITFFEVINRYSQADFIVNLSEQIDSRQKVIENMSIDVYNQGKILSAKYKFLTQAYNVFLFGFISSVITFIFIIVYYLVIPHPKIPSLG